MIDGVKPRSWFMASAANPVEEVHRVAKTEKREKAPGGFAYGRFRRAILVHSGLSPDNM